GLLNTSEGFRNTNYKDLLKGWLPTVAAEWAFDPADPGAKPRSAPLPMGASRPPPVHRGVLFVGDAAGLVNPFNGEGIDYALESGELAAQRARATMGTGDRA